MDLLEWKFVCFETHQVKEADNALKTARVWRPPCESRKAEATTPAVPAADITTTEAELVPKWDGEPDQTGVASAWSSGQNSEWTEVAVKDQKYIPES